MTNEVINLATYYTKKTDIVDNLTTNDSTKMLSAKQGKELQDNKLNINQGIANASKNVITDAQGNITTGELTQVPPSINIVDIVEDGNQDAVSSNAVYDAIQNINIPESDMSNYMSTSEITEAINYLTTEFTEKRGVILSGSYTDTT